MAKCVNYRDGLCLEHGNEQFQRLCNFSRLCFNDCLDDLGEQTTTVERSKLEARDLDRINKKMLQRSWTV